MKKRACALLAALIALSLLPAACTPKITATEDVTATVESVPTETEAASAETISAEGPAAGGTLYFRFGSEPATLDPQRAFTAEEDLVLGLVGGTLVTFGPGGEI